MSAPESMETFLTTWHDSDPLGFVKALNARARRSHVLGAPTSIFLKSLILHANEIVQDLQVQPTFFADPENYYLLAALADAESEDHNTPGRTEAFYLARSTAALVIGRHGAIDDYLQGQILEQWDEECDRQQIALDGSELADAAATAPLLSPLGLATCLERQSDALQQGDVYTRRRSQVRSCANQGWSQALATAMRPAIDNPMLAEMHLDPTELAVPEWIVLPDHRFAKLPVGVFSLAGGIDHAGVVVCSERTARRLIAGNEDKPGLQAVKNAYLEASDSYLRGLDQSLYGLADALRVVWNPESRGQHVSNYALEYTLDRILTAVTGQVIGEVNSGSRVQAEPARRAGLVKSTVDALGLRGALTYATLDPYGRSDAFVCAPTNEPGTNNARYMRFVQSVTQRRVQVDGWDALAKSTKGILHEIYRQGGEGDHLGALSPDNMEILLNWEDEQPRMDIEASLSTALTAPSISAATEAMLL